MGLRCLLGHDFDEPETERERNEEGNEVVVTVREVKTCTRCGEKQVVSENKEITSIDQLRESATGEPVDASPSQPSPDTGAESETTPGGGWGTDELSTGGSESIDAGADTTETPSEPAAEPDSTPDPESTTASEPTDPVDRGVADIIEQAEKDDDMLESPPEESEPASVEPEPETPGEGVESEAEDDEDVPVHPGKRSAEAEESEGPDPESDDGVILDEEDDTPPEEGRRQWEEEASPEDVPGQDLTVTESSPDGEDAVIIDDDGETEQPATESEPQSEPTETTHEPEQTADTPSAVESEDAEIMDTGPEPTPEEPTEPAQSEPETTEPEREETDEGHMPWPDAPGEDEGHDATTPDGEPADIEFGGGIAPSDDDTETEESDAEIIDAEEVDAAKSAESVEPPEDQANGHRTEAGEESDASTAPTANVDLERSTRDAGMEYYCPECGLTRDVGNSSMRAGDICPECRKGYITEQQKAE